MTIAKLDTDGQRWVASLPNYNFKNFYRSGKLNVEAYVLSRISWKNTQVDYVEPMILKSMLQSKLVTDVGISDLDSQLNVMQKSMVVDNSPKLTHDDWVKELSEDSPIGLLI